MQVPEYLGAEAALKSKGIEKMFIYCVNDGAVMSAWGDELDVHGSHITLLADPNGALTHALGMAMTHPGPAGLLGPNRCKRFVLVVEDGKVTNMAISEAEDDPAGDNNPEGPVTALTRLRHVLSMC